MIVHLHHPLLQEATMQTLTHRIGATALLLLLFLGLAACSTNPATGRAQLNVLSESEEIKIGQEGAPELLAQFGGPVNAPRLTAHVDRMGQQMAGYSERPHLPWKFYVMDSGVVNAFAMPGGQVFLSRGLIEKMDNDAQLAAVIGHEIGHVTAQHAGQQISRALILQGLVVGASVAAGQVSGDQGTQMAVTMGAQVAATVTTLHFSRGQEHEADTLGLRYMTRAGYNPVGMVQLMEILRDASGGGGIEFLQTHPLPASRIRETERMIVRDFPDYDDPGRWKMGFESFKVNVADELAKLPEPRHKSSAAIDHQAIHPLVLGCGGCCSGHGAVAAIDP